MNADGINPVASLYGGIKALMGRGDWPDHFDLSRQGFKHSFIALALTLPAIYLIAYSVQVERAVQFGEALNPIPLAPFAIILGLYLLTFSACAYIFAMLLDLQDRLRPWVITRHWCVFWLALSVAVLFGLYLIGVLPFGLVNTAALTAFLGLLLIDIRLGQIAVPFKMGAAILIACFINAMGLVVVLLGFEQVL